MDIHRISPLAIFIPPETLKQIVLATRHLLDRRKLVFLYAQILRGRGRIPNVVHEEARRLDRAERLLLFLRRPRADPRQIPMEFLRTTPVHYVSGLEALLKTAHRQKNEFRRKVKPARKPAPAPHRKTRRQRPLRSHVRR